MFCRYQNVISNDIKESYKLVFHKFIDIVFVIQIATDKNLSSNLDMGKSSFPEGDRDPLRAHERVSVTTNDIFYGKPAVGLRNKIVDGSHLRTESHVDLGAARGAHFYETSMKSDFTAVTAPYKKADPGMPTSSSIPLDYYSEFLS